MFQVLQHFGLSDYRCSGFSRNISLQGSSLLNECLLVQERSLLFILLFYNQKTPKNPSFIAIISQSFLYPFSQDPGHAFHLKRSQNVSLRMKCRKQREWLFTPGFLGRRKQWQSWTMNHLPLEPSLYQSRQSQDTEIVSCKTVLITH